MRRNPQFQILPLIRKTLLDTPEIYENIYVQKYNYEYKRLNLSESWTPAKTYKIDLIIYSTSG